MNAENPWFKRGGNYNNGANAGAFNFDNDNGNANNNNGFRSVVSFVTTVYERNLQYLIFKDIINMVYRRGLIPNHLVIKHINSRFL